MGIATAAGYLAKVALPWQRPCLREGLLTTHRDVLLKLRSNSSAVTRSIGVALSAGDQLSVGIEAPGGGEVEPVPYCLRTAGRRQRAPVLALL